MTVVELQVPATVRTYAAQALCLMRAARPTPPRVTAALEWALVLLADGHPTPPLGFLADLGNLGFGFDPTGEPKSVPAVPNWPPHLARGYEDHVLGKLYADWTFERAADALRRYAGKDRAKALAYVARQYRDRSRLGGTELPVAAVRNLLAASPDELLRDGQESLSLSGPVPLLVAQYEDLIAGARRTAEVLGAEDVIALEQRTAIADLGQYIAHRQILKVTAEIEARLPTRPVKPLVGRRDVPTRVMDEDQYPVGGYTSISNRGSVESLLHSQLAFMEPHDRPDLFDVKFVRDELFYYSRDENQFLRRRRVFCFLFRKELVAARFKDADAATQRIVLACGLVLAVVRRLELWLSTDAIRFEVLFEGAGRTAALAEEADLFSILLAQLIERGAATVDVVGRMSDVEPRLTAAARTAQTHLLDLGGGDLAPDGVGVASLTIPGPCPVLTAGGKAVPLPDDEAHDAWITAALRVLQLWV